MSVQGFHSGKRLKVARKLFGYTQERIIGARDFPLVDVRTVRMWESKGINTIRIEDVAKFFNLRLLDFVDDRIDENTFIRLVATGKDHVVGA